MARFDIDHSPVSISTSDISRRHHYDVDRFLYTGPIGSGPPAPSGSTFYVAVLTPYYDRLELQFNLPVVLSGPALVPENWSITGGTVAVNVIGVEYSDDTVTLYITEPLGGEALTLNLPIVGITTPI